MKKALLALAPAALLALIGAAQAAENYGYCVAVDNGKVFLSAFVEAVPAAGPQQLTPDFSRQVADAGYRTVSEVKCAVGTDRDALERARRTLLTDFSGALYLVLTIPPVAADVSEAETYRGY